MTREKADLIIHPVRLQILQTLSRCGMLTTGELADELPAVPKSSLYRHLNKLLDGGMVKVEQTRQVRGAVEKTYTLLEEPNLDSADVADFDDEDHIQLFTIFTAGLIHEFSDYIRQSEIVDLENDRTGYTIFEVYASRDELDDFGDKFSEALKKLIQNKEREDRHLHKLVMISHPLLRIGETDE